MTVPAVPESEQLTLPHTGEIRDVVKEQVTYTVDAREAKRVAGANEEYAAVVARVQNLVEKKPYIVVRRA